MIPRMTRRRVHDVFVVLIVCVSAVCAEDADDITTIYRFNETDDSFRSQFDVKKLDDWNISPDFLWTYNSMVDVPFPGEGYVSWILKPNSISNILPINTTQTFAVSSNTTSFNVYLMSNKDPQLGNIIVIRLISESDGIEVLTCKYGTEGDSIILPGIGLRKCLQQMPKEKIVYTTYGRAFTLYFEPYGTVSGSRSGFLLKLPSDFNVMKYISVGNEEFHGYFKFRKPARVLALAESTGYISYQLPYTVTSLCLSLLYYMDQKSGGEISLYHKENENDTLLGKLFSWQQMDSWKIHRFVVSWEVEHGGYLEVRANRNSNAPLLIHSLQSCEETDSWDSTTFTKPGTVDIHARTNALGRPFYLHNGSIIDPNVDIDIPSCPKRYQDCEWALNNWSRVEKYIEEMKTAPLPLWREDTHSLIADGRLLSKNYIFTRHVNLNFDFKLTGYQNRQLYMYITTGTAVNRGFSLLIRITSDSIQLYDNKGQDSFECWIPNIGIFWCRNISQKNLLFSFMENTTYQMSMNIDENLVTVVFGSQSAGLLVCSVQTSNMNQYTPYYLSFATTDMEATATLPHLNYMLSLDQEEGSITSPLILPTNDELCVSVLYYKTRGTLTLGAELLNGSQLLLEELNSTNTWKYERIVKKMGRQPLRLLLQGSKNESSKVMVQRIAGCHPEEDIAELGEEQNLRVISPVLTKNAELTSSTNPCKNGGVFHKEEYCVCPPGFIGTYCEKGCGSDRFGNDCNGRCSYSERECMGLLLCKPNWGCSCAPGYKGFTCSVGCGIGEYGAGCRQTCGHCSPWDCDSFTGMCLEGCQDGYHPPMCREKCSYFGIAPLVQRSSGKISIVLPEQVLGKGSALYYQIQYKEEIYSPWLTIYSAPVKNVIPSNTINITEPSTRDSYFIRVVIINEDACSYQGDTVPFVELKTTCKIPDPKEYRLAITDVGDHNFTLIWQPPTNNRDWCELSYYEVFLKEGWKWSLYSTAISSSLIINKRSPGQNYQVKLRAVTTHGHITGFSETLEVKTNMMSVGAILNFRVATSDSTQPLLKWEYPYSAKHFLITYECIKLLGCPDESCDHSKGQFQSQDTSAILRDLIPLAQYKVKIAAFSSTFGPLSTIQVLTPPAGSEETPTEVEESIKDRTNTSFTVQWGPPSNCSKLNGFQQGYWYRFRLAEERTTLLDGSTLQTSASFTNLTPHTQYRVDVFVVTNGGWDEKYPLTIPVSTRATTPERVANLTVYKMSRREIGLRWGPPARTYGELQSFTISYVETSVPSKPSSKVIRPTSCSAWPDLYCFTVKKLRPNVEYSLSVQARNMEVSEDGDASTVLAKTQEGSPTAPSYIHIISKDYTSITVQWGIPWMLNGILRSFFVSVEGTDSFNSSDCCQYYPTQEMPVKTEESFYQIEVTGLQPASTYVISVSGKTGGFGPAINLTANTKPPLPNISSEPRVTIDEYDEEIIVQLTPVTEFQDLVRGYLLLLAPEYEDQDFVEATIWDGVLAEDIKTAINRSFYIVGEYSQDQLTRDGVVKLLDQERQQSMGILGELSEFNLFFEQSYKVILVVVLEYEGAYSFSFKESDTFTATFSLSSFR